MFAAVEMWRILMTFFLVSLLLGTAESGYSKDSPTLTKPTSVWKKEGANKALLICLHDSRLNSRSFESLGKEMSNQEELVCVSVDMPGFGSFLKSDSMSSFQTAYTLSSLRTLILLFKKTYHHLPFILCGEGLGAAVALEFAAQNPNMLDGLVISSPATANFAIEADPAEIITDKHLAMKIREDSLVRKNDFSEGEKSTIRSLYTDSPKFASMLKDTPTIVLQGSLDTPENQKAARKIFGSVASTKRTFLFVPNADHYLLEINENNLELAHKLASWIKDNTFRNR